MQRNRQIKDHRDKILEAMLSVATYRAHMPRFITWLDDRQITEQSVAAYFAELKHDDSPARSRVVWRAAVKRGLREAAMRGLLDPDHLERWLRELDLNPETQAPRVVQTEVQWITPEEYYQVLEACQGDRQRLYMEFLWTTGSRVSEMAAIRLADCTPSDMNVVIHLQAKSHKQREVRIPVELWQRINDTCRGKVFLFETSGGKAPDRSEISRTIANATERALGVRHGAHVLRHSFAMRMARQLPPDKIPALSRYVGHSSVNTTLRMYTDGELDDTDLFDGGGQDKTKSNDR